MVTATHVQTTRRDAWVARGVRLLDVDPDLATGMTRDEVAAAGKLILPTIALQRGPWSTGELQDTRGVKGDVLGFLMLDGAVCADLTIGYHTCTRLITSPEMVLLDGRIESSIEMRDALTALEPSILAILDVRLLVIGRRWPALMTAIMRRAAQQLHHGMVAQAIAHLPTVEQRLLALLWSIADRRGEVRGDGVWVALPVTHQTLAQMIGARRPTVSLGLRALRERGLVTPAVGGFLLLRGSLDCVSTNPSDGAALPARPGGRIGTTDTPPGLET